MYTLYILTLTAILCNCQTNIDTESSQKEAVGPVVFKLFDEPSNLEANTTLKLNGYSYDGDIDIAWGMLRIEICNVYKAWFISPRISDRTSNLAVSKDRLKFWRMKGKCMVPSPKEDLQYSNNDKCTTWSSEDWEKLNDEIIGETEKSFKCPSARNFQTPCSYMFNCEFGVGKLHPVFDLDNREIYVSSHYGKKVYLKEEEQHLLEQDSWILYPSIDQSKILKEKDVIFHCFRPGDKMYCWADIHGRRKAITIDLNSTRTAFQAGDWIFVDEVKQLDFYRSLSPKAHAGLKVAEMQKKRDAYQFFAPSVSTIQELSSIVEIDRYMNMQWIGQTMHNMREIERLLFSMLYSTTKYDSSALESFLGPSHKIIDNNGKKYIAKNPTADNGCTYEYGIGLRAGKENFTCRGTTYKIINLLDEAKIQLDNSPDDFRIIVNYRDIDVYRRLMEKLRDLDELKNQIRNTHVSDDAGWFKSGWLDNLLMSSGLINIILIIYGLCIAYLMLIKRNSQYSSVYNPVNKTTIRDSIILILIVTITLVIILL